MVRNRIAALVAVFALLSGNALFSAQCQGGACKGRKAAGRKAGAKAAKGKSPMTRKVTAVVATSTRKAAPRPGAKSWEDIDAAWDVFAEKNDITPETDTSDVAKIMPQFLNQQINAQGKTMFLGQFVTAQNIFSYALDKVASSIKSGDLAEDDLMEALAIPTMVIKYVNDHSKGNYAAGVNKMQQALNKMRQDITTKEETGEEPEDIEDFKEFAASLFPAQSAKPAKSAMPAGRIPPSIYVNLPNEVVIAGDKQTIDGVALPLWIKVNDNLFLMTQNLDGSIGDGEWRNNAAEIARMIENAKKGYISPAWLAQAKGE
jgi:hypothetical protein